MPRVAVFAINDALASSITAPIEMLRAAAQFARASRASQNHLELVVASEHGGTVSMSGGLSITATLEVSALKRPDLLIIPSLWRAPARTITAHPQISAKLAGLARSECLICAAGTGSYFMAALGVLDDRPATTHWSYFEDFAQRFPRVQLRRQHLITQSGRHYCAGSVNSVADLMIHFIHGFYGQRAAQQVEGQFSPEIRRPFETHSFVQGQAGAHPDEAIWQVQDWIARHLGEDVSLDRLAEHAGLSVRGLTRRFRAALGTSPGRYIARLRMDMARDLLRQTNVDIADIAQRTGFSDASHFSRTFARECGTTPSAWRARVRGKLFVAG